MASGWPWAQPSTCPRGAWGESGVAPREGPARPRGRLCGSSGAMTYAFTKYVAMSRAGWGGGAAADLKLARQARKRGFARSPRGESRGVAGAVAVGHRDRRRPQSAAGRALGALLSPRQHDSRHRMGPRSLRVDPLLCGSRLLGQRYLDVPGPAAAASAARGITGHIPSAHAAGSRATGARSTGSPGPCTPGRPIRKMAAI